MSDSGTALIVRAVRDLTAAGVPDPQRDARRLFAHAAGIQPDRVTLVAPEPVAPEAAARFADAVARRAARQPVSQIVGWRDFYGRRFRVTPDTLDPRPETEAVVAHARAEPFRRVLDLGTGTGAVGVTLALERPAWRVILTDASAAALAVARDNAEALGAAVSLVRGDWLGALAGPFDLIVSNPPYVDPDDHHLEQGDVRFEPRSALAAHDRGLADLRVIAAQARERLAAGGWLMLEHGHDQGGAVRRLLAGHGFHDVTTRQDLGGNDRVTLGHV